MVKMSISISRPPIRDEEQPEPKKKSTLKGNKFVEEEITTLNPTKKKPYKQKRTLIDYALYQI